MFIALSRPFPDGLNIDSGAVTCLAYRSHKGIRALVGALTEQASDGTQMFDWHAAVAEELNNPPSLEYTRLMLRSIKETWREGDRIRQMREYGRLDFSRVGQGGHGFDDGDGY